MDPHLMIGCFGALLVRMVHLLMIKVSNQLLYLSATDTETTKHPCKFDSKAIIE